MEIDETSYNALVARVDYLYKHIGNIKKDAYKAAENWFLMSFHSCFRFRVSQPFARVPSGLEMEYRPYFSFIFDG